MRARSVSAIALSSFAPVALAAMSGSSALAASITYVSQSGVVSASGSTPTLGSSGQSFPFAGLDDVNLVAQAADGVSPAFYSARAELHTTLDPTLVNIAGQTTATAGPIIFGQPSGMAYADVDVTLRFDLDEAAPVRVGPVGGYGVDYTALRYLDSGFQVTWDPHGAWSLPCGGFPLTGMCGEMLKALTETTGGVLPSGHYELVYSLFAFQPQGSCAVGCRSALGTDALRDRPRAGEPSPSRDRPRMARRRAPPAHRSPSAAAWSSGRGHGNERQPRG